MSAVTVLRDLKRSAVDALVARYGTRVIAVAERAPIPASYWGEPEAGLTAAGLHARPDTPVHSLLHELGHFVCARPERRRALFRDAGGDPDEECAVCYLQVVLADELPGFGRARCVRDMDAWGYGFREGSAAAWLAGDAADARAWLGAQGVLDTHGRPSWRLRSGAVFTDRSDRPRVDRSITTTARTL